MAPSEKHHRYEQGSDVIERLIGQRRLQIVQANPRLAEFYLAQASKALLSARAVMPIDEASAFVLIYDGARKALASLLIIQGLRPAGEGAHAVLLDVAYAQFAPPHGAVFAPFEWMRELRNLTEYPAVERPVASAQDVAEALPVAEAMIIFATSVLPRLGPFSAAF